VPRRSPGEALSGPESRRCRGRTFGAWRDHGLERASMEAGIEQAGLEDCYRRAILLPIEVDPGSTVHEVHGDELVVRMQRSRRHRRQEAGAVGGSGRTPQVSDLPAGVARQDPSASGRGETEDSGEIGFPRTGATVRGCCLCVQLRGRRGGHRLAGAGVAAVLRGWAVRQTSAACGQVSASRA